MNVTDCPQCQDLLDGQPMLTGACASIGIEHGISTAQALTEYLAAYHDRGHRMTA